MIQSDVLSEEYRTCILKCIHKYRSQNKIRRLGYTIDEIVNEVLSRTWVNFINKKDIDLSFGTIADNQLRWALIKLRQKPLPVLSVNAQYIDTQRLDNIEEVNLLLKHSSLSSHERQTLEKRFLHGKTFDIIASELSLTRERVRQIQLRGLRKLKKLVEVT